MFCWEKVPKKFWVDAVVSATYLWNVLTCWNLLPTITQFKLWQGMRPDIANVEIFRLSCWYHMRNDKRGALKDHKICNIFRVLEIVKRYTGFKILLLKRLFYLKTCNLTRKRKVHLNGTNVRGDGIGNPDSAGLGLDTFDQEKNSNQTSHKTEEQSGDQTHARRWKQT